MFNLEKIERYIIIFLILSLLLGLAVSAHKRSGRPIAVKMRSFDTGVRDRGSDAEETSFRRVKVDINSAGREELMKLKGVGPVMADRIIEYRSSEGSFTYVEDIKKVKGIGPAFFEKIKDNITVE
ncbi:MAG: helix-hairpin-helix domain-containing protein [Candidatus Omnitrophota bacterium]|nr:helix-hairpin-helix domain-containing protein [Candidatus Omnitrophota bacterium]